MGINTATAITGAKVGALKGFGKGGDFASSAKTVTKHTDDVFAKVGDWDLGNVLDGNPNIPADRSISAKKLADTAMGVHNPHYDTKHGAYTTLQQQYDRAMYGTNPQNNITNGTNTANNVSNKGKAVDASKFFNSTDLDYALKEAERLYAQNPSAYTTYKSDGTIAKITVPVDFNRPVGHGYMGNNTDNKGLGITGGEYRWTNTVTVELGKVSKKPFTAYPNLSQGWVQPDPIKH